MKAVHVSRQSGHASQTLFATSFGVSLLVHGLVIGWMLSGSGSARSLLSDASSFHTVSLVDAPEVEPQAIAEPAAMPEAATAAPVRNVMYRKPWCRRRKQNKQRKPLKRPSSRRRRWPSPSPLRRRKDCRRSRPRSRNPNPPRRLSGSQHQPKRPPESPRRRRPRLLRCSPRLHRHPKPSPSPGHQPAGIHRRRRRAPSRRLPTCDAPRLALKGRARTRRTAAWPPGCRTYRCRLTMDAYRRLSPTLGTCR